MELITSIQDQPEVYDILGIGFGPANLSISVVLAEMNLNQHQSSDSKRRLKSCFLESHDRFRWHPGMMIPGSRMQISFLKDLATFRNPSSPFTFLQYLHSHNRLASFVNRSTFTPTRREFADYLTWSSNQVIDRSTSHTNVFVKYDQRVINVEPISNHPTNGDIDLLKVISRSKDGQLEERLCRNLIISTGGTPSIPLPFPQSHHPRIIHTSQYLSRIDQVLSDLVYEFDPHRHRSSDLGASFESIRTRSESDSDRSISSRRLPDSLPTTPDHELNGGAGENPMMRIKIAVIGGGQSAAETLLDTYHRLNRLGIESEIELVLRKGHLHPSDDSAFSNEIFDPDSTETFYGLGEKGKLNGAREIVLNESKATNYGVVNPETLKTLYETIYAQRVEEEIHVQGTTQTHAKIKILNHSIIRELDSSMIVTIENLLTGERTRKAYDAIILGTGYKRQCWKEILFNSNSIKNENENEKEEKVKNLSHLFGQQNSCEDNKHQDLKKLVDSLKISRNYRLELPKEFEGTTTKGRKAVFNPTIWLQGCNESTHGIGDSLLSNLAVRSGEVVDGILAEGWFGN